jgi:hypothetical protein
MKTSVIKVLVVFQMSVRELKLGVKRKLYPKNVLKDPDMLESILQQEVWLGNRVIYKPMFGIWTSEYNQLTNN